jgi:hypothetical protein
VALFACRGDNRSAAATLKDFLDEFYSGQAQSDMTSALDRYTEWPDFVVGNAAQIATEQDIRLVAESAEEATFEVRYKVIGEENLGKLEMKETQVIQSYRLRRRRGQWRILQPIQIPCVSVAGELTRLRTSIENATKRIGASDFTAVNSREYFETLISNANASIALLERYR